MKTYELRRSASGLLLSLLALVLLLPLAGCAKKKIANPYEAASLVQAVSGQSENKLFKFELDAPKILGVAGRLALVSEGDRIEFLVGDDLSVLNSLQPGSKLGVRRFWGTTPEVFLALEHVITGTDTVVVTSSEAPAFPSYQNEASFDRSAYSDLATGLSELSATDRASILRAFGRVGTKVWLSGQLSRTETGNQTTYFLATDFGKFRLNAVNALSELFLKAVLASGGRTSCYGTLGELYRRIQQRESGVTGPISLEFFEFQNYVITNG